MYNSTSLHDKIMHEYEKIRYSHKIEAERMTSELYEKLPGIKIIDDKISTLVIKYASKVAHGDILPEEAVAFVDSEKQELIKKRSEILEKADISEEHPQKYSCSKCCDTGYIGKEKCSCYIDIMKKLMLSEIDGSKNVSFDFDKDNFDNFSLEWYSRDVDSKLKVSAYDNMKNVLCACKLFCFDFKNAGGNLFFYGKSGTGKTFMASCIANALIKQGCSVTYQSAYKLFQFMEDYKFGKINRDANAGEYESVYNSDLLIIDDLGTEFTTSYTCSVLFDILNSRLINGKSTIISTNLGVSDLEGKYTDRVSSRIIGNFEMMRFIGNDIRIAKKYNRR